MLEFCALDGREVLSFIEKKGERPFRKEQLFNWVYRKGVTSWEEMRNLPIPLRAFLRETFALGVLSLEKIEEGEEVTKFLWKLFDERLVESVLICSGKRRTVCLSSQVGCPARCAFCASGREGMIRNLTPGEIIEQVVQIHRYLMERNERVSHLVFMGMGEPLENYETVIRALRILIDPNLLGFSPRKITLSTVGVVPNIYRFMEEGIPINLALSLHAPNQTIRKKIVPYARKYPLEEVLKSVRQYGRQTKRDVTYEYVLLEGINDGEAHAIELAQLLQKEPCTVNLIPFNPVPGICLKRPSKVAIESFRAVLKKRGIRNTWRYTKGKEIASACGQLALKGLEQQNGG